MSPGCNGSDETEGTKNNAVHQPMQRVGSLSCFPIENGELDRSGLTIEDWVLERSTRKPLTIQWPAMDARISLCWRAPACLPEGHGMNLLDVIE